MPVFVVAFVFVSVFVCAAHGRLNPFVALAAFNANGCCAPFLPPFHSPLWLLHMHYAHSLPAPPFAIILVRSFTFISHTHSPRCVCRTVLLYRSPLLLYSCCCCYRNFCALPLPLETLLCSASFHVACCPAPL